ncbi:hypothetical protein BCR44DRAFT_1061311 [Catenaria anguillulae PL171]|uniref:Uncharacterized protein n=1 Tax=Catenaria anguillulae PL171 TaxID=765915 RepID=A0A1Y2HSV3_9FUNG|nr:hypothetical protein BCR44DRAFT_1061311 [Catenaria anguillulae PL171]
MASFPCWDPRPTPMQESRTLALRSASTARGARQSCVSNTCRTPTRNDLRAAGPWAAVTLRWIHGDARRRRLPTTTRWTTWCRQAAQVKRDRKTTSLAEVRAGGDGGGHGRVRIHGAYHLHGRRAHGTRWRRRRQLCARGATAACRCVRPTVWHRRQMFLDPKLLNVQLGHIQSACRFK